jgi:hypothetical protein
MKNFFLNQFFFFKFILHIKNFFLPEKYDAKNLILVEFNTHKPALIGLLLLLKVLRNYHKAQ